VIRLGTTHKPRSRRPATRRRPGRLKADGDRKRSASKASRSHVVVLGAEVFDHVGEVDLH
jgi:hypothetical protein